MVSNPLNYVTRFFGARERAKPFQEQGTHGYRVYGGYVQSPEESSKLQRARRPETIAEILVNTTIVSASLRYFLNLLAKPSWSVEPAKDIDGEESSDQAKLIAELVEASTEDLNRSWSQLIRQTGMYKFYGFSIQEWIAKRSEQGSIVFDRIEARPQFTVTRWDITVDGVIRGVWQRDPQTGQELYLPSRKLIYVADNTLTDMPDGLGILRHTIEPAKRLDTYLQLEGIGFDRDMRGTPIGRAPYRELDQAVKEGRVSEQQRDAYLNQIERFVKLQAKTPSTSIVLDSEPYDNLTNDGNRYVSTMKFGLELLKGPSPGFEDLDRAINRTMHEIARIFGTENLLLDQGGSHALSKDKSQNLFMQVSSTLNDIVQVYNNQYIDPIMWLNGFPDELKPTFVTEELRFMDFEQITQSLNDMARSGAVLAPDDPAINDVRDLMGISRAPELE